MRTVKDRQGFLSAIERTPVGIGAGDMPEERAPRRLGRIEEQRQMGCKVVPVNGTDERCKAVARDVCLKHCAVRYLKCFGCIH